MFRGLIWYRDFVLLQGHAQVQHSGDGGGGHFLVVQSDHIYLSIGTLGSKNMKVLYASTGGIILLWLFNGLAH